MASLKIEGRLKSPEYVANITRIYRQALRRASSRPREPGHRKLPPSRPGPDRYEMEMAFLARALHRLVRGHQQPGAGARPVRQETRGVIWARVAEVRRDRVASSCEGPLKPGDGVVFDAGHPEQPEEGGRVYEIRPIERPGQNASDRVCSRSATVTSISTRIHAGRQALEDERSRAGAPRCARAIEGDTPRFPRPIDLEVHGLAGNAADADRRVTNGRIVRAGLGDAAGQGAKNSR